MGKGLINGGFFIFNKKLFSYLTEDKDCDLNLDLYKKFLEKVN